MTDVKREIYHLEDQADALRRDVDTLRQELDQLRAELKDEVVRLKVLSARFDSHERSQS